MWALFNFEVTLSSSDPLPTNSNVQGLWSESEGYHLALTVGSQLSNTPCCPAPTPRGVVVWGQGRYQALIAFEEAAHVACPLNTQPYTLHRKCFGNHCIWRIVSCTWSDGLAPVSSVVKQKEQKQNKV